MAPPPVIEIDPADEAARGLWRSVLDLAAELPPSGWILVGGLMVQCHAYRHGQGAMRATDDIDVLADSRARPKSVTELVARKLVELGYEAAEPTGLGGRRTVYRFRRDGGIVDVLGPDGLKRAAKTLGNCETIQVKGGTQALSRSEEVIVELDGRSATLRCPNLLGAILLKSRAVTSRQQEQDAGDLVRLLSFADDPLEMRQETTATEARWLRSAGQRLALDDPGLRYALPADQLIRARQAFALLVST